MMGPAPIEEVVSGMIYVHITSSQAFDAIYMPSELINFQSQKQFLLQSHVQTPRELFFLIGDFHVYLQHVRIAYECVLYPHSLFTEGKSIVVLSIEMGGEKKEECVQGNLL